MLAFPRLGQRRQLPRLVVVALPGDHSLAVR